MREFGSEHPTVCLPDDYFKNLTRFGICTWLRSGREALYLIALSLNATRNRPIILMPAYSCHSMIDPFEKAGWEVVYYSLNENLSVSLEHLNTLLLTTNPTAALIMNFFGSVPTNETVSLIKTIAPQCVCIEDFSHCTFSFPMIYNPQVEYYVSSIRKSVGVCDGAVIVSQLPLDESYILEGETQFTQIRSKYQKIKGFYLYTHDESSKKDFLQNLHNQEDLLNDLSTIHHVSEEGWKMLMILNGEYIRYARQKNMEHLYRLLNGKVKIVSGVEKSISGAPFSFPILVDNRDIVQKQLAERGVYAPVLWPISDKAKLVCPVSTKMSSMMLSLPIDQRYNYDDIELISQIVLDVCIN